VIDGSALTTVIIAAASQTGALIYFAGAVSRTLKDHDRRHEVTEGLVIQLNNRVNALETKIAALEAEGGRPDYEHRYRA